jgi:hypothetical protein
MSPILGVLGGRARIVFECIALSHSTPTPTPTSTPTAPPRSTAPYQSQCVLRAAGCWLLVLSVPLRPPLPRLCCRRQARSHRVGCAWFCLHPCTLASVESCWFCSGAVQPNHTQPHPHPHPHTSTHHAHLPDSLRRALPCAADFLRPVHAAHVRRRRDSLVPLWPLPRPAPPCRVRARDPTCTPSRR